MRRGFSRAITALMPRRLTDSDIDRLKSLFAQQHRAAVSDITVAVMATTAGELDGCAIAAVSTA